MSGTFDDFGLQDFEIDHDCESEWFESIDIGFALKGFLGLVDRVCPLLQTPASGESIVRRRLPVFGRF